MGFGADLPEPDRPETAPEVALAVAVDARTPAAEEPADTVDADLVDEPDEDTIRQELLDMAAQHTQTDRPAFPAGYECEICGATGKHFEDECPNSGTVR